MQPQDYVLIVGLAAVALFRLADVLAALFAPNHEARTEALRDR